MVGWSTFGAAVGAPADVVADGVSVLIVSGGSDLVVVAAGGGRVETVGVTTGAEPDGTTRAVVGARSPPRRITTVPITARTSTVPATAATQRQRVVSS